MQQNDRSVLTNPASLHRLMLATGYWVLATGYFFEAF
jgi:hypothetical protein